MSLQDNTMTITVATKLNAYLIDYAGNAWNNFYQYEAAKEKIQMLTIKISPKKEFAT